MQKFSMRKKVIGVVLYAYAAGIASSSAAAPGGYTSHADWAEQIARNVLPQDNAYTSDPTMLTWSGINGATKFENRTVCNTFLNRTLMQSYGLSRSDLEAWTGSTTPNAGRYYDLILAGKGFQQIGTATGIKRGDIIAVKYQPCAKQSTSGHVMIALGPAVEITPIKPFDIGSRQFVVQIADSASGPHFGPNFPDTRADSMGNEIDDGAGVGYLRLFADDAGNVTGYSWSPRTGSAGYPSSATACRPVAIGRLY